MYEVSWVRDEIKAWIKVRRRGKKAFSLRFFCFISNSICRRIGWMRIIFPCQSWYWRQTEQSDTCDTVSATVSERCDAKTEEGRWEVNLEPRRNNSYQLFITNEINLFVVIIKGENQPNKFSLLGGVIWSRSCRCTVVIGCRRTHVTLLILCSASPRTRCCGDDVAAVQRGWLD